MNEAISHPTPRPRDVLLEQLRAVGLALRGPAAAAVALLVALTVVEAVRVARTGAVIHFQPHHQLLPGLIGLLVPFGVWKGEDRFGDAFLWTLPVDRRSHALAKVLAGWAWTMGAVGLFVVGLLVLVAVSGGGVLPEETIRVLAGGGPGAEAVRTVRWTPPPALALVPFTAATGTYLLASALVVGARHPLRWVAAAVLALFFAEIAGGAASAAWLADAPERILHPLFYGRYGVEVLLTAGASSPAREVVLPTGEKLVAWRAAPDAGQWAAATLLWTAAGLAAAWAAASRHRELRRG